MTHQDFQHATAPSFIKPQAKDVFIRQWMSLYNKSFIDFENITTWNLQKLPDFNQLLDMDIAVERIINSITKGESIGVFGDYDVDGTTSCALLYRFFRKLGIEIKIYQPSRFIEGYGLHVSSVDQAYKDGIKVLITVDCGSSSLDAALRAKELGLDLIITDHHKDAAASMPESFAFINPNRRDEFPSPLQSLAGVGVAFALSVCIRQKLIETSHYNVSSLYDLLPYVAIGTISDLAPLNEVNLILCRHGYKALEQTKDLGLLKFLEEKPISSQYIESEIISFFIGPMINSKGRLDHPEIALLLLISDESSKIETYFQTLKNSNSNRKLIQQKVFEEAKIQAIEDLKSDPNLPIIMVKNTKWHEGVIGIVASKLVEEFNLPTLVFTSSGDEQLIKASARTAKGIDIFELLKLHATFFLKFGGHKAAAGLTMNDSMYEDFKKQVQVTANSFKNSNNTAIDQVPKFHIDFDLIDGVLLETIYKLAPFGQQNPMPKWEITGAKIESYEIIKDGHVQWKFTSHHQNNPVFARSLRGISFNYLKKNTIHDLNLLMELKRDITIDAQIKVNQFRGKSYLNLQVDLVRFSQELE